MNLNFFESEYPHIINSLRTAKKNSRLAHAYLIYCDDVSISKELSLIIAAVIACDSAEGPPCMKCKNCLSIAKDTYPDIHKLEPLSKSRRILIGDGENDPNTMRWFQSKFYYSSLSGSDSKKIGIISAADRINIQAQNAFLKTLEEPPPNSHFILTAENPKVLLPTVLSRCQKISLLTNKIKYNFSSSEKLFNSLWNLVSAEKNIFNASKEIATLCEIFSSLKEEVENDVTESFNEKNKNSYLSASEIKKQLGPAKEAAISAEYILRRNILIDAIITWNALHYQIASGLNPDSLANRELINADAASWDNLTPQRMHAHLEFAERLSWALRFNIDDTLALHEFVMSSFFKI